MKRLVGWLLCLGAMLAPGVAVAQQYPAKPVRIVVGFAPGGGSDFIARLIAQKLTERFGTQVMVENRPGAGSTLAAEQVVKSPADGYTILLSAASYTVNPALYKLSFDPLNDITPIVQLSRGPYVVAVHPSVPAKTLQELVALARQDPDKLAYASSGNGSHVHVATEYLLDVAKIRLVHVPYKGTGPALNDTIGGQVQVILGSVATALQHVRSGRLRALAVTTPKRIAAAADVPTVQEAGFPAYEVTNWHGLVGPKGLPKDVLDRLSKEVNAVLQSPEMAKILASDGLEPAGGTPEEFAVIIKSELVRWNQVVKQAGVKLE
ncbi:MAG: tripartite tricarboxylate transporter substrate binding protein [Pseudomonadota bacterium]|nr:tripartite tricarboxylate transporter substrate binding protein [Pseudomonadota bacterium]